MTDDRMWNRYLFRRRSTQPSRSRHKNGVISSKKDDGIGYLRAIDLVLYLKASEFRNNPSLRDCYNMVDYRNVLCLMRVLFNARQLFVEFTFRKVCI